MPQKIYDSIIIGAGPAGMTAGIYTARRALSTLIIGKDVGGQMSKTTVIENAAGVETINGIELAFKMKDQAESFGVEFDIEEIEKIEKQNDIFNVVSKSNKTWQAKSVVLAFGLEKRTLNLPTEKDFVHNGISYCVTCDGPLMKGKEVVVVGGGNSGAEAAEFLAKICPKVYWLEITDKIIAEHVLVERIKKLDNVKILTNTSITEFEGDKTLEKIKIKSNNQEKELAVQGAIIEIGYLAKTDWLKDLVELDKMGQIKIDDFGHTNVPGIFAAGDVTNSKYKQIVVAEGMGAIAGLEVANYINNT